MSHLLDRLTFFTQAKEKFSDGHGVTTAEARDWEDGYRKRWQHDKIVRSTHGVNCTGSCSWKIYVKGGIVTWETQQTDYPRTRPELLMVHLLRPAAQIPAGQEAAGQAVARGKEEPPSGRGLGLDPGRSGQAQELYRDPRPWRLRPFDLGRGQRDHRCGQCLYGEDLGP